MICCFFFFKQKTAYEMRISDWSSDVCSSDLITGEPPAFCAGADLSHLSSSADGGAESGLRAIYEGFLRIGRSPLPTIAAVHGAAVGAGMNLAPLCDVRLASPKARFNTRFLQLGLHPGGGHTWLFPRIPRPPAVAPPALRT